MAGSTLTIKKTLCNRDCPDTCGIVATVENGRIVKLRGDPGHPITRGFLCFRTHQFLKTQYSGERIKTPLLRKNGRLTAVSWDEALDVAAGQLQRIRSQYGPAAIFHYRSGGSLGALKALSDYFFELFGPVTIKRGDICSGAGEAAQALDFGLCDSSDPDTLLDSKHILLWGKNVHTSSPHTIPILNEAKKRGARLTLIDPVHHAGVKLADRFHQVAPGGDFALCMAVAQVLFERGHLDPAATDYCQGLSDFRSLAMSRSVDSWCREADLEASAARELAEALGPGKPCAILVGWGMGRRSNGGAIVRALDALSAISGNLGIPGGGVSFYFRRRSAFDLSFIRGQSAAPRTICEPLFARGLADTRDPAILALWVTAGNPVAMLPDSKLSAQTIEALPFSVVVDSFLTDTARLAKLVLPTTTLLEDDDLLGAYGHHYIGVSEPVVPPPPGVKSELQIIQALASRVGLGRELGGDARYWKRRIAAARLSEHGVEFDQLEHGPIRNPGAPRVLFEDRRFFTPSGRVNLLTSGPPPSGPRDEAYPLSLMALSTPRAQSSQWAMRPPSVLQATVHPACAAGVPDGGRAELESRLGRLPVAVHYDPQQRKDVVVVPKGGHYHLFASANALVQARTTDLGEGGALYEEGVRLLPC